MNQLSIQYRHPRFNDGGNIYRLIKDTPPLDVNSQYCYYLLCRHFSKTCVVAEYDDQIVGFLSSYIKPEDATSLFMWQIAVSKEVKDKKIGSNMLRWLVKQPACKDVNRLEATISPSSQAPQKLLKRIAREHNANYELSTFLEAWQFGDESHEDELLFIMSPFNQELGV